MACSSSDFDALTKVLSEVRSIEDFIFYGLGAIDGEVASNFCFNCLFLSWLLFGFGLVIGGGSIWLVCGHEIN